MTFQIEQSNVSERYEKESVNSVKLGLVMSRNAVKGVSIDESS